MSSTENERYFRRYGAALIDSGYAIVPIGRGTKFPQFDGWEDSNPDQEQFEDWLENGITYHSKKKGKNVTVQVANSGLGILCKHNPAVDLDITDKEAVKHMEDWVSENIGMAPVRVGNPPKRLMLFRADAPFTKMQATFIDEFDQQQKLEILGDGQQFVAFAIHPDTNKPYKWLDGDGPHVTASDDLPTLTRERAQRIIDEFRRLAKELGWKEKRGASRALAAVQLDEDDAILAEDTSKTEISDEELRAKLLMVPNNDDHDTWFQVGMALYHQFDGDDTGLQFWHDWSSSAHNYDPEALEYRWTTFDVEGKRRAPITARYIIKLAKEAIETAAVETVEELRQALKSVETLPELKKVGEEIKKSDLDQLSRDQLTGLLRDAFKKITGQVMPIRTARDLVRYENPEMKETPRWLEDWVYLGGEDKFYNTRTGSTLTQSAFNASFSRFMLTKKDVLEGRSFPETLPVQQALNVCQISIVEGKRYMPGQDAIFTIDGTRYANTYRDIAVPEVPEKLTSKDKLNIQRVKDHFEHLFADERERNLLIDWMAYVVQNPGKRVNWTIMLQGTQGDGKTFFGMLMGAMLGADNMNIVDPKLLEDKFTGWGEGAQFAFLEEVKMHGHNRYDVLNRLKPFTSNRVVTIRRMNTDPYKTLNMTSYMMATNFRDALPLDDEDGRYFPLFSRFQFKAAIQAFKNKNPDYYRNLYATFEESPGAIRGWFLEREFGDEFDPDGRAPESKAKAYMAMMGKSDEQEAIEDLIREGKHWDMSDYLLNATDIIDELSGQDIVLPHTRLIHRILSGMGFTFLGKIKIKGEYKRFWSKYPERFIREGVVSKEAVRKWIDNPL